MVEPYVRGLAYYLYGKQFVDHDDLDSVVNSALADAYQRYDPSRGRDFISFALDRMRSRVMDFRRDLLGSRRQFYVGNNAIVDPDQENQPIRIFKGERKHRRIVSIEIENQYGERRLDRFGTKDKDLTRLDDREEFAHIVKGLQERERTILCMYFQQGRTMAEIGEHIGFSESRVCQIFKTAIEFLRERMGVA